MNMILETFGPQTPDKGRKAPLNPKPRWGVGVGFIIKSTSGILPPAKLCHFFTKRINQ